MLSKVINLTFSQRIKFIMKRAEVRNLKKSEGNTIIEFQKSQHHYFKDF